MATSGSANVGTAAVDRPAYGVGIEAAQFGKGGENTPLHRMVRAFVARRRLVQMQRRRQEAGVLARAVVVQSRRCFAGAGQAPGLGLAHRRMRPAGEVIGAQSHACEPTADAAHVIRFAAVGGAGQGQLGVGDGEPLGGAGFDQRQRLQRLDRRTRIDRALDVPPGGDDSPVRADDGGCGAVAAFDGATPRDFDSGRIFGGHRQLSAEMSDMGAGDRSGSWQSGPGPV